MTETEGDPGQGMCRLCGSDRTDLTLEHIPPQSTGNKGMVEGVCMAPGPSGGFREFTAPKGMAIKVLCPRCNSRFGSSLGTTFSEFAHSVEASGMVRSRGDRVFVGTVEVYPARLYRQLLLSYLCLQVNALDDARQSWRDFIRSRDVAPPTDLPSIALYFNVANTFRVVPAAVLRSVRRSGPEGTWVGGEIVAPGLGVVFSLDGEVLARHLMGADPMDISSWASAPWDRRERMVLELPARRVVNPRPLGFGTAEELERTWDRDFIIWLASAAGDHELSVAAVWRRVNRRRRGRAK